MTLPREPEAIARLRAAFAAVDGMDVPDWLPRDWEPVVAAAREVLRIHDEMRAAVEHLISAQGISADQVRSLLRKPPTPGPVAIPHPRATDTDYQQVHDYCYGEDDT